MKKNYMTQVTLQTRDKSSGLMNKETIYHLNELGQAIVFAIQDHENRIQKNEDDISILKETVQKLIEANNQQSHDYKIALEEIKKLQEENNKLKYPDRRTSFAF